MKKNILTIAFTAILSFVLFLPSGLKAQDKSYWELNLNGGTSLFFGDIKQYQWVPVSNNENEWRFGAGLQFGRQLSYVFGVRGQALYGQLAGTKREWKRYFQSDYIETNLNFTINFNNLFGAKRSDRFFNLYMITGVGLTQYNTTVYELGTNKIVAMVGNGHGKGIGGRTLEGILTVGMGADLRITDNLHVTLESVNRGMNSDAYDHWEKGFPFDVYNYTSLGLSWRFGVGKTKPPPYHNTGEETPYYDDYNTDTTSQTEDVITPEPVQPGQQVEVLQIEEQQPVAPPVVVSDTASTAQVQQPKQPVKPDPEYRVQIKAKYGKPLSREKLSVQYNIPIDEIMEDRHNGYYIYTVGSYATYNEARDRRNVIRNVNGIYDAFVVAFNKCGRLDKLP